MGGDLYIVDSTKSPTRRGAQPISRLAQHLNLGLGLAYFLTKVSLLVTTLCRFSALTFTLDTPGVPPPVALKKLRVLLYQRPQRSEPLVRTLDDATDMVGFFLTKLVATQPG